MSESTSDTKLCPFCAETIKAAAVKCRYCGSELDAAPDVPPPPPPPPVAEPVPSVVDAEPAPPKTPGSWPRWFRPALAVSVLVTIVLLVLAFLDWRDTRTLEDARSAGDEVRASVTAQIEALLGYDHTTFDADQEKAQAVLTDSFRDKYADEVEALRASATEQKLSQEAVVVAVSVVNEEPDEVEALVFVNTTTTAEGDPEARLLQNRINVDLVRSGDRWLIDAIRFPQ